MPRGNGGIIGPVNTSFSGVWSLTEAQLRRSGGTWPSVYQQAINELSTGSDAVVYGSAADPYFEYTTLLLPGNGTNLKNNNEFLDSSANAFTITRNPATGPNAPTQGTFSPFSQTGWGNYFNGSSGYFTTPANAAFAFGTGDFTVEMFVNTSNLTTGGFVSHGPAATTGYWAFELQTGSFYWQASGVANILVVSASSYLSNSVWTHLCVSRVSGTLRMFANGTQIGSATDNTNYSGSSSGSLSIGRSYNNLYTTGYISNLRIVKGTGVTTVTVPTAPLTAISGTSILTCQSNRFVDNSSNAFALTLSGSPSVQAFSPFNPTASWSAATYGGSGYFDGNGDYLTASGNAAFAFGTGDFTVGAWIYPTTAQTVTVLSSNYNFSSGTGNWALYFGVGSAQTLYFNSSSGNKSSTVTTTIPLNAWTYVAYTRVGTTAKFFVNGSQLGADISDSFNYGGGTGTLYVGRQSDGTGQMVGYMSSIQVLKGTGYSTLPIPTAPPTAITNTSLLLNFSMTTNRQFSFNMSTSTPILSLQLQNGSNTTSFNPALTLS